MHLLSYTKYKSPAHLYWIQAIFLVRWSQLVPSFDLQMELPVAWTAHPRGGYDELLLSQNNDIFSIISDISLENINNNSFYDSILNNLSYSLISNTSFDISLESQTTTFNDVNHNTTLFSILISLILMISQ